MGHRRRSDVDLAEGIAARVGLVFLFSVFHPKFVQGVMSFALLCVGGAIVVGLGVVVFLVLRARRRRMDSIVPTRVLDPQTLTVSVPEQPRPVPRIALLDSLAPTRPMRVTEEDLRRMDWYQFEKVVGVLYEGRGWRVERRGGANPDGGIDLALHRDGERVAVQCKHWGKWKVREGQIRDFFGGMKLAGFERGILATLVGCTTPAQRVANETGISIVDLGDLKSLVGQADAHTLERIAAIIDDPTKHCPKCGAEMVIRTARRGPEPGSQFWACTKFPRCNGKMRLTD